jgi:hypothetical protein
LIGAAGRPPAAVNVQRLGGYERRSLEIEDRVDDVAYFDYTPQRMKGLEPLVGRAVVVGSCLGGDPATKFATPENPVQFVEQLRAGDELELLVRPRLEDLTSSIEIAPAQVESRPGARD